jgi:hypothetical protein
VVEEVTQMLDMGPGAIQGRISQLHRISFRSTNSTRSTFERARG